MWRASGTRRIHDCIVDDWIETMVHSVLHRHAFSVRAAVVVRMRKSLCMKFQRKTWIVHSSRNWACCPNFAENGQDHYHVAYDSQHPCLFQAKSVEK